MIRYHGYTNLYHSARKLNASMVVHNDIIKDHGVFNTRITCGPLQNVNPSTEKKGEVYQADGLGTPAKFHRNRLRAHVSRIPRELHRFQAFQRSSTTCAATFVWFIVSRRLLVLFTVDWAKFPYLWNFGKCNRKLTPRYVRARQQRNRHMTK